MHGPVCDWLGLTEWACDASDTALSMKSWVIFLVGCSLNTEFIRAILAALLRASALVGQTWIFKLNNYDHSSAGLLDIANPLHWKLFLSFNFEDICSTIVTILKIWRLSFYCPLGKFGKNAKNEDEEGRNSGKVDELWQAINPWMFN